MSESGTTKNNSNVHVSETKPIHNRQSKRKRNTYTRPRKNPTNLLHSNQSCDTNRSNEMSDFRNLIYPELILTVQIMQYLIHYSDVLTNEHYIHFIHSTEIGTFLLQFPGYLFLCRVS
ncbi:unnamed protein product [Rhizophagus irregularis]|nr:unnamed protein product [Rhizophagus irregularis]CAB5353497.1 unnamed protein product [Rhizophagus irregularis]